MGNNTLMFTLPKYGGQSAIHDTNGDGLGDRPAGCLPASRKAGLPIQQAIPGSPITTTGTSSTSRTPSNPRGITIPQGRFTAFHSNSESLLVYGPYAFSVQYASLSNEVGNFSKNGGIGSFTWSETVMLGMASTVERGQVIVTPGSNRFGGTMKMLGTYYTNGGFYYKGHLSVAKFTWLFQYQGQGGISSVGGAITQWQTEQAVNDIFTTLSGATLPSNVLAFVMSWTTGTISLTALHGPFPTVLVRSGFDNRNATGMGEIQMVTPMLTRWVWAFGNYESGDIGKIRLNFTPEPQEYLMLGAGISLLGLLYRSSRRSR